MSPLTHEEALKDETCTQFTGAMAASGWVCAWVHKRRGWGDDLIVQTREGGLAQRGEQNWAASTPRPPHGWSVGVADEIRAEMTRTGPLHGMSTS